MSAIQIYDTPDELATAVAKATVDILWAAINKYDNATWVLAGGLTPLAAYRQIVTTHQRSLDWSKVTVLVGDERMDKTDRNWNAVDHVIGVLPTHKIESPPDENAEDAAKTFTRYLDIIPELDNGLPRFDLVWLGVGEDGHTLSLFPNHESLYPTDKIVIPVHNSPKPPADRISLSLRALQGATNVVVIASGTSKQTAVQGALAGNNTPIDLVTNVVATHGGNVTWFLDRNAAPLN